MTERMSYRIESNHLATPESAKLRTEQSPKSKLNEINLSLNSAKSNEAKKLKELINKREYREFQKTIWITRNIDLDWKLWPRTFESFNAYLQRIESTNTTIKKTNKNLSSLKENTYKDYVHKPEYQQLSDSAKIHKNAKEYLYNHRSLSDEEYNRYFSGKEQLAQWQVWNCYMVSWVIELANTQYFDVLMKSSISRVRFRDDGLPWFNVRIPLWEPNGRDILIKDYELDTAKIKWSLGYKLLEIAYVKSRRQNNEAWNRYYPVSEKEYQDITWWSVEDALETFLGKNNIWFSNFGTYPIWEKWRTLSEASQSQKTEIINYLKNFNWRVWNRFTSLATAPSPRWDTESFNVWWKTFWKGHAYALDSVEKDWRWNITCINVKNPWNNSDKPWGSDLALSLNEFFHAFSYVWVWKIKVDTFLDNKWIPGVNYNKPWTYYYT